MGEKGSYIVSAMVSGSQIMINSGIMRSVDMKYGQKVVFRTKKGAVSFYLYP